MDLLGDVCVWGWWEITYTDLAGGTERCDWVSREVGAIQWDNPLTLKIAAAEFAETVDNFNIQNALSMKAKFIH